VLSLLSLLSLSSCSPREPDNIAAVLVTETGEVFRLANNDAVNFHFYYPENFILDKNAAMISIFITDHEFVDDELETGMTLSVPVNPNLTVNVFTLGADFANVEQYWNDYIRPSLNMAFSDISIESSADVEVAGLPGRKYVYSASLGGQEYKCVHVIFFRNREVYKLLYTATPGTFDRHSGVVDVVTGTFTFE
jgi:hypothetical protein